jgi:catechol 2,3-dioxygenase-like lactoylglutathione lyase family enzyme
MRIDHVVLWVADPLQSVAFLTEVLGCEGVRVETFYFTNLDGNVLEAR